MTNRNRTPKLNESEKLGHAMREPTLDAALVVLETMRASDRTIKRMTEIAWKYPNLYAGK